MDEHQKLMVSEIWERDYLLGFESHPRYSDVEVSGRGRNKSPNALVQIKGIIGQSPTGQHELI